MPRVTITGWWWWCDGEGCVFSPGSGWATQGHSETCPEAFLALFWVYQNVEKVKGSEYFPKALYRVYCH
jgi:hypothetical protein